MKDFIANYAKGTANPLTLLLAYTNDKDEVIKTILNTESLKSIYDVVMLDKICKSLCNENIKEEGYVQVAGILTRTAKLYVETIREMSAEKDQALLSKLATMDCKLDDYSGPDEILTKLKDNSVLKEYLPEAMRVCGLDVNDIFVNEKLSFIDGKGIISIIDGFVAMKTIVRNIHSILDDDNDIDSRIKERYENLSIKVTSIFESTVGLTAGECQYENFISLTDRVRDMHSIIKDTYDELNSIKEKDIFDFKVSASDIILKLTSGDFGDKDVYVFEKAVELNDTENETYSKLIERVTTDLETFNAVHAVADKVLEKINL